MNRYLEREGASGVCRRCDNVCLYTKSTCDNCGDRLAWADGVADRMGKNCPRCAAFNTYVRKVCTKCDEQLPWHDCPAANYHAAHNADKEQKTLTWSIVVTVVIVIWFTGYIMATLQAQH